MSHEQQDQQASRLRRFGIAWNGPLEPLTTPMADGYWTPWHLAQAAIEGLQGENERLIDGLETQTAAYILASRRADNAEAQLAANYAEIADLRQRDKVISRQLERVADGYDPLTKDLRERLEAAEAALTTLRSAVAQIEQELREYARRRGTSVEQRIWAWADALTHPPEPETGPQ